MTIEKTAFLYEILIRLGPDGYAGGHVIDLERIIEDGQVIAERELPARPITRKEVGPIIGAANARLIEAADAAIARAQAAETEVARLKSRLEEVDNGAH